MPFQNIPLKTIQADLVDLLETETMPWYDPVQFPVPPGNPTPNPQPRGFRWKVTLNIEIQQQSSYITRNPGLYNGLDITIGQWIANVTDGRAWQIISIESKTDIEVIAIVQDIFRYNTFADPTKTGNGSPTFGTYIVFNISDGGLPQIDPVPAGGISASFTQNISSRFQYINLQYDYPLYQAGNTFAINDTIAADSTTNSFVLSDAENRIVIGRVTSISDIIPGWFTINPVAKIVDFLDYLPGDVSDILYTSLVIPGEITVTPGGTQIYIKLRNNTSSVTFSTEPGSNALGNTFQVNGIDVTVTGTGTIDDIVAAGTAVYSQTKVAFSKILEPNTITTNISNLFYGEIVLDVTNPATATINGVGVTFDIPSTNPGYEDYTQAAQMVQTINNAGIPNIIAASANVNDFSITNTAGGSITIVNTSTDVNGINFAGPSSGSGIPLNTPASSTYLLKLLADDARAINLLDVVGSTIADYGIPSVENGVKACGLYIEEGLRTSTDTVVTNLAQLNALSPLIGDQAYVINSDDGQGNNVNEWSMWLYNGVSWMQTSNEGSSQTDAKSLEYGLTISSPSTINIGEVSTGRRITLITVEVLTPFDNSSTLSIGYQVNNPSPPPPEPTGLMAQALIDLTVAGTYTTTTDILFGTDTVQGDVTVTADFQLNGSTTGSAQIIVSYV